MRRFVTAIGVCWAICGWLLWPPDSFRDPKGAALPETFPTVIGHFVSYDSALAPPARNGQFSQNLQRNILGAATRFLGSIADSVRS